MTVIDQLGYVTIYLDIGEGDTVSVRLNNIKPTATDQDVYDVATAVAGLLAYPINSIRRTKRADYSA
ncbi:MAG TPA: DUF1659 domain-containing protein [Caldisericia bacterium]|jgi:hypothetical protein|nr:DUF1659 domain-containing protein [Caldisericia bacterium]